MAASASALRTVGRRLLDHDQQLRHLDSLLAIPELHAINGSSAQATKDLRATAFFDDGKRALATN